MDSWRVRVAFPALALCAALPSCSLFVPKLETPNLSVVGVRMLDSNLWHQSLQVRMKVRNPNDRALPVKGLSYQLDIDGQDLAHGASADSFVVPALGEVEFDLNVSANMAGMLVHLMNRGKGPIDYRISGKIALSSGLWRTIPFNEHGTFRWQ